MPWGAQRQTRCNYAYQSCTPLGSDTSLIIPFRSARVAKCCEVLRSVAKCCEVLRSVAKCCEVLPGCCGLTVMFFKLRSLKTMCFWRCGLTYS